MFVSRVNEVLVFLDESFCIREHSPKKAIHMARGNINPITMEVIDAYSPSKVSASFP